MMRWLAALALLFALPAFAQSRPTLYSQFDTSISPGGTETSRGAALKAAILATPGTDTYLYLQAGSYLIDNPVVIDRTSSLVIHGIDRMGVFLVAMNPALPMIRVDDAPLVQLANLHLQPTRNATSTTGSKALSVVNTAPSIVEILDTFVNSSTLEFAGPGRFHLQQVNFGPTGKVQSPLVVDHPQADVLIFGGGGTNGLDALAGGLGEYSHIWQKQGRMRVYQASYSGGLGPSDVRIETRSTFGPHVIAAFRSEGVNGILDHTGAVSRLLYVPPTPERVDVVIKNSRGASVTGPIDPTGDPLVVANCKLVSYNGAGRLWILGSPTTGGFPDQGGGCLRSLVEGVAPLATIISVGNHLSSPEAFPVTAGRVITAVDAYDNERWTGSTTNPRRRWVPDGTGPPALDSYAGVPFPPPDVLPGHIERPRMDVLLPGFTSVSGVGIQAAFDASCAAGASPKIYIPQGTHQIIDTIYHNTTLGGTCAEDVVPAGGWIAGAGADRMRIKMARGVKKGTFLTGGLSYAVIQGITFETWAWETGDPELANVALEWESAHTSAKTVLNSLYDVEFNGGYAGFTTGSHAMSVQGNCASTFVFDGVFKNAYRGFVSGHQNALLNAVYDSLLQDNHFAMGTWGQTQSGGNFSAYRSRSRGNAQDFDISPIGGTWYFYEWDSDAPQFVTIAGSSVPYAAMWDRAYLEPRAGSTFLMDWGAGAGPFFLDAYVTRAGIRLQGSAAQNYAVKMNSTIEDWDDAVATAPNGQLEVGAW